MSKLSVWWEDNGAHTTDVAHTNWETPFNPPSTLFFHKNNFMRTLRLKITKILEQSLLQNWWLKLKFQNSELHHVFSMFIKNKIKNIEAQIGEILRTSSLGENLLVLIKKECTSPNFLSKIKRTALVVLMTIKVGCIGRIAFGWLNCFINTLFLYKHHSCKALFGVNCSENRWYLRFQTFSLEHFELIILRRISFKFFQFQYEIRYNSG